MADEFTSFRDRFEKTRREMMEEGKRKNIEERVAMVREGHPAAAKLGAEGVTVRASDIEGGFTFVQTAEGKTEVRMTFTATDGTQVNIQGTPSEMYDFAGRVGLGGSHAEKTLERGILPDRIAFGSVDQAIDSAFAEGNSAGGSALSRLSARHLEADRADDQGDLTR